MPPMAGGRISTVSSNNRGPLLNITSWICMVAMSVVVGVKIVSKVAKVRQLQTDDYFIAASMLVAIVECIMSNIQAGAGLGSHMADLTDTEKTRLQKATYTAQILYVAALYFARLGVLRFLLLMARDQLRRRMIHAGTIFAAVCGLAMELVLVFQCPPPETWAVFSAKCVEMVKFWTAEGVLGVAVDALLAFLPVYLVYDVHLPREKKVYVMGAFLVRLLVIPLMALRLASISDSSSTADPSYDIFKTSLYTQIHLNISIILSCVPFLKPFTDSLQTGILTSDLHTLTPANTSYPRNFKLRNLGKDASSGSGASNPKERWMGGSILEATRTTRIESEARDGIGADLDSRGTSEERLVIKQTVTVAVESHDKGEPAER